MLPGACAHTDTRTVEVGVLGLPMVHYRMVHYRMVHYRSGREYDDSISDWAAGITGGAGSST